MQDALTRRRLGRGDALAGWKLGYTTEAMRVQMGIAEPNFGPLLASMHAGRALLGTIHPRVEPEIALILDRDPGPHASAEDVLRCCRSAHLALELVDSVWAGYRFDLEGEVGRPAAPEDLLRGGVRSGVTVEDEGDLRLHARVDGRRQRVAHVHRREQRPEVRCVDAHLRAHDLGRVAELPADQCVAAGETTPGERLLNGVGGREVGYGHRRAVQAAPPRVRVVDQLRDRVDVDDGRGQCSSSVIVTRSKRTTSPNQPHSPHQVMKLRVSPVQYSVVMPPCSPIEAAHIGQNLGRST